MRAHSILFTCFLAGCLSTGAEQERVIEPHSAGCTDSGATPSGDRRVANANLLIVRSRDDPNDPNDGNFCLHHDIVKKASDQIAVVTASSRLRSTSEASRFVAIIITSRRLGTSDVEFTCGSGHARMDGTFQTVSASCVVPLNDAGTYRIETRLENVTSNTVVEDDIEMRILIRRGRRFKVNF